MPGRVEQLVVDPVGEQREQAVDAANPAEQLVASRWQLVFPQVDLARLANLIQARVRDDSGDEHARLRHCTAPTSWPVRSSLASDSATRSRAAARFSRELA